MHRLLIMDFSFKPFLWKALIITFFGFFMCVCMCVCTFFISAEVTIHPGNNHKMSLAKEEGSGPKSPRTFLGLEPQEVFHMYWICLESRFSSWKWMHESWKRGVLYPLCPLHLWLRPPPYSTISIPQPLQNVLKMAANGFTFVVSTEPVWSSS